MQRRILLAVTFVVAGGVLPLLPLWIMPLLRPTVHYLGDAKSLLADRRSLLLFAGVSALPFVVLAVFTWFHLNHAEATILHRRSIAILATFGALFILGWWCYMPQTVAGMNFAVVFFPMYAAIAAPLAYGLARLVTRRA